MKSLIAGDKPTVRRLAERLKAAGSHTEYQRIQCVLIRATLGSSAAEIAQLLGWSTATVHVMHSRWAKEGEAIFDVHGRGGRRHQRLTPEQERELLAPFVQRAEAGGMLGVAEIQQAYRERCGQAVARSTVYRLLERHGWRKVVPRPGTRRRMLRRKPPLKKLRRAVRQEVLRQAEQGRRVRLMFQDEGRFGLLGTPRRCWAPLGTRPVVGARLQRKYLYAFSAVSPHDGVMDSLVLPWVSAQMMSMFLQEVAQRHAEEFVVMVMDRAGWHIAGQLVVPPNMRVIFLPAYSPELNPAEHLWEALREDCFANHVFNDLRSVERALTAGIVTLESDSVRTRSMAGFKWITSISLNAT